MQYAAWRREYVASTYVFSSQLNESVESVSITSNRPLQCGSVRTFSNRSSQNTIRYLLKDSDNPWNWHSLVTITDIQDIRRAIICHCIKNQCIYYQSFCQQARFAFISFWKHAQLLSSSCRTYTTYWSEQKTLFGCREGRSCHCWYFIRNFDRRGN